MGSCFASVAIRCRFVDTEPSLNVLVMFLSNSLDNPASPFLHGVSHGWDSPASRVLWDAPRPCRPSRRTSLPSLGDTTPAALSFVSRPLAAPTAPRRTNGWPGVCYAGCPIPALNVETTGLPRFLGNPNANMPCSSTPAGPAGPDQFSPTGAAFRSHNGVGSRDDEILSGLNDTAYPLAVYALCGHQLQLHTAGIAPGPRKTRFRLLTTLPGGIGYPLGSVARFSSS